MLGYRHTDEAKEKMKQRFLDKSNHPMFGKNHSIEIKKSINKPGPLNPLFNKKHNIETKIKMSLKKSKRSIGLFDQNNNLINIYPNQVVLAKEFSVFKTTIRRYIKSGKLF